MTEEPLVSVCIVTYNSAEFIIEALDSVAAQTYKNIELIVSDDASTDNTVELCRDWIANNEQKFSRSELVVVEKNTGVSANFNRAIRNSGGFYIKGLAGDDKLLPNCIADNVSYMMLHPETDLLFSDYRIIGAGIVGNRIESYSYFFNHFNKRQFKLYQLVYSLLPAPTAFMTRGVYNELGGYDETIPMMEDKPFWVKALFAGKKIGYFKKPTVEYRVNPNALSQTKKSPNYNKLTESRKIASKFFLEKMKTISILLWFYRKNSYDYEFQPSVRTFLMHSLRFINPYFYYLTYLKYKMVFYRYFEK